MKLDQTSSLSDSEGGVFTGVWEKGRKLSGKMKYADGGVYRGKWEGGQREGKGVMKYAGGMEFVGQFESNLPQVVG